MAALAAEPVRLHPDNPHYFLFQGKPTVLITSGEHYGAVLNRDFDYARYLNALKEHGFNLTRVFSGTYREVPGSFNITGNTLAPAPGSFLCPWARRGEKFDLAQTDPEYFKRLKAFVKLAGEKGIVVELVLFCTMYDEAVWKASPMNAVNNVNGVGKVGRYEVYSAKDKELLAVQKAVVWKIVSEMNAFKNLYYELCNEPYERGGLTEEWNEEIISTIVDAEASMPWRHLIAQGFPHSSKPIPKVNPHVSVINFHAAKPEFARVNYALNRVLADDETGGSDRSDRKYRTEAWQFMLAGGAVFDHLDFSFTTQHPDGMAIPLPPGTPGGGGPEFRRQLGILKRFLEGFDFIRMVPQTNSTAIVLAEAGKAYAAYLTEGTQRELQLDFPKGAYKAEWLNPKTGQVIRSEGFKHESGSRTLGAPQFSEDVALRLTARAP